MAVDFSKFDKMVDKKALNEQIEQAGTQEYDEVPEGKYIVSIEKMEIKETRAGDGLNFSVQMKIVETVDAPNKQDGRYIFLNRKIYGNKTTEKWNDGKAIAIVTGWINKFADPQIEFQSYEQFANDILDIYQDQAVNVELEVKYEPDAFVPVEITEVYDK